MAKPIPVFAFVFAAYGIYLAYKKSKYMQPVSFLRLAYERSDDLYNPIIGNGMLPDNTTLRIVGGRDCVEP